MIACLHCSLQQPPSLPPLAVKQIHDANINEVETEHSKIPEVTVLLSAGNVLQPGAGAMMARVAHFLRSDSSSLIHTVILLHSVTARLTALSSFQRVSRDGARLHRQQTVLLRAAGCV